MSNTTDKMLDRYIYLDIDPSDLFRPDEKEQSGITIHVKMDDEGIAVDAWAGEDECVASTWKTYNDMGVEVRELLTIEKQHISDKKKRRSELNAHNDPNNPFTLDLGGEG